MTFGCKLCTIVKLLWGRPQLKLHNNKWKQYSTSSNRPFISQCIFGCFQNSPCKYERYPAFSSLLPSEQSCCGQLLAGRSTGGEFGPGLEGCSLDEDLMVNPLWRVRIRRVPARISRPGTHSAKRFIRARYAWRAVEVSLLKFSICISLLAPETIIKALNSERLQSLISYSILLHPIIVKDLAFLTVNLIGILVEAVKEEVFSAVNCI